MVKFTVLGGSSVAVPELISALAPHIHSGRELCVVLHGRDAAKLETVGKVCQQMASSVSGFEVEFTTDLKRALKDADYVLNQVRVGGFAARGYDETFPHRWNIPGEETVGPGGAAYAMRAIPVVLELCQVIHEVAPNTHILTFSNPSSIVQRAISLRFPDLKVVGLCDGPCTMHNAIAKALGTAPNQVKTQYVGMHHFGFITSAKVDGAERIQDALADDSVCNAMGVDPAIGRAFGVLPHMYFKYFFHPDRMLKKQKATSAPRAHELQQLEAELLEAYGENKPNAVKRRSAIWYEAVIAPAFVGMAYNAPARLAVNLTNHGLIEDLPDDTIIEITADIQDGHIYAQPPHPLPPPALFGMLQANAAYEYTLVEAILNDSADLLLEAFLINPLISSYDVAKELVAEVWERRGWPPEQYP